jgi:hypothetical protein
MILVLLTLLKLVRIDIDNSIRNWHDSRRFLSLLAARSNPETFDSMPEPPEEGYADFADFIIL